VDPPLPAHQAVWEADFVTNTGGCFFLLNALNRPALQALRQAWDEPHAGWRALVRLALSLDWQPDEALARFLAAGCGLRPGQAQDLDVRRALSRLSDGHDAVSLREAVQKQVGATALQAALAPRPARLCATASHIDLHLRLRDVDLAVRRQGLDLDPGWLPWLGRVLRFHYDWEGASP
jgi:hypothetical protein